MRWCSICNARVTIKHVVWRYLDQSNIYFLLHPLRTRRQARIIPSWILSSPKRAHSASHGTENQYKRKVSYCPKKFITKDGIANFKFRDRDKSLQIWNGSTIKVYIEQANKTQSRNWIWPHTGDLVKTCNSIFLITASRQDAVIAC